jgi:hypothetical protein
MRSLRVSIVGVYRISTRRALNQELHNRAWQAVNPADSLGDARPFGHLLDAVRHHLR